MATVIFKETNSSTCSILKKTRMHPVAFLWFLLSYQQREWPVNKPRVRLGIKLTVQLSQLWIVYVISVFANKIFLTQIS